LTACKKAVYKRNCCEQSGEAVTFFGGYVTVPNAFTPNGDGEDDLLVPISFGIESYTMKVVLEDETLFSETNQGWNGMADGKTEDGIYGYVIDVVTTKGDAVQVRGQVCLITDPADTCIKEADNCRFGHQFVPDAEIENVGKYDNDTFPGPVFCDE